MRDFFSFARRTLRTMATARAATTAVKRVPIPANGVDYRGKLVLAPMVRSGECPSRLLALQYGADLVWGPETIDKALIGCTRRMNPVTHTVDFTRPSSNHGGGGGGGATNLDPDAPPADFPRESLIYRLHPQREGRRLIYQLGTADPDTAVQAAQIVAADVAGIDVNAGCPKPFSTKGGMGAALLQTPDTLCAILRALVRDVGTPFAIGISVKIRLLPEPARTEALVRALCQTGITGLTVHCRTTPMRPRERAIRDQLQMIAGVCRAAGVACLMNGDVVGRDAARALVAEYGVDGAMIATAAETNPSVFRTAADGGLAPWEEVVLAYLRTCLDVENRWGNTKYLLGQMIPGKAPAYRAMMATASYAELVAVLGHADLSSAARDVDRRLGIGEYAAPKMTKAERKAANKAAAQSAAGRANERVVGKAMNGKTVAATAGVKRTAETAELEMPLDVARDRAPGSVADNATVLAV